MSIKGICIYTVSLLLYMATALGNFSCDGPSIVLVHIGKVLPSYLTTAVKQARLFNDCPIILIANEEAISQSSGSLGSYHVTCVSCESLKKTTEHQTFIQNSKLDKTFRNGFWNNATERFFYLQDLMEQYQLHDVVHLENDVMLYVDILSLIPLFKKTGMHVGLTLDNDERCIPGFVNESCVFNPSFLTFFWKTDDQNRKVPFAQYGDTICRINNLHIHSKHLDAFLSDR